MKVSSFAGEPAESSMLGNVPKLITAYYTETSDPSIPEQRISFGTSGHRGSAFQKAFKEWHILAMLLGYAILTQMVKTLFIRRLGE